MRWKVLDSGPMRGAELMAIDAGLLQRARETGEAVLRVYAWSRPALSFGVHEAARGRFSPAALEAAGVDAVRRPTGGRALLHDHEVTYSVTAPTVVDAPVAESYARINALLLDALGRLGVRASVAPRRRTPRPGGGTCFSEPSAGELVVDGRKLVGSAQVRERGALLQHGSILLEDDQGRISGLASAPLASSAPAATLSRCMGRAPAYAEVRDALVAALTATAGDVGTLGAHEAERFAAGQRARFLDAEWTWRR